MLVWRCVTTTTAYFIVYSTWIQCQPTKMTHTHTQKKLWYVCVYVCVETLIHPSHPSNNNKSQTHNDNSNNNNNNEKASAHIATSTLCVCSLKSIRERYGNRQLVVAARSSPPPFSPTQSRSLMSLSRLLCWTRNILPFDFAFVCFGFFRVWKIHSIKPCRLAVTVTGKMNLSGQFSSIWKFVYKLLAIKLKLIKN